MRQEVVVFDLEYTAWPGSHARGWSAPGEHREVVQIGAVRLAAGNSLAEVNAFDCLVRPAINPALSDYFVALTGISNADVAARGIGLAAALARFASFVGPATPVLSNGADVEVLLENCALADIRLPLAAKGFHDIGDDTARLLDSATRVRSCDLPALVGGEMPGRAHDALADARGIALTLRALRKRGVV